MRVSSILVAIAFVLPLFGQQAEKPPVVIDRPEPEPSLDRRCCVQRVFDGAGQPMGEVMKFGEDFVESLMMRYRLKDGDTVALRVTSEYILSSQMPGGSSVLFLTSDCSGDAFSPIYKAQPMARQAVVLPVGVYVQTATQAWLYVSDHLATRVMPAPGTIFKAQWGESGSCVPYPPPGYTYMGSPFGGYWMKRVEDLYAKYKRPFWIR
jgi:hypothetical protein